VPADDRPIWATAFYAGLRLGELRALDVDHVGEHSVAVEWGWDPKAGRIDPKSAAGVREVPIPAILRAILDEHIERTGRSGDELIFGRTPTAPFTQTHVQDRADDAWTTAGLQRVSFHSARHFHKSAMHHAGISQSRADTYAGHADGRVGNRYRHILPGQLAEDAALLNRYLVGEAAGKVVRLPTGAHCGAQRAETA